MHPASQLPEQLLRDCDVRRQRRSGPGGQHRNKVETGVFLRHLPTGVEASATEERSQSKNLAAAARRLRVQLAIGVRLPAANPTAPSLLWTQRCQGKQLRVSVHHDDYPTLLAEALDVLWSHHGAVAAAAEALGCSSRQFVKLIAATPAAFVEVNRWRQEQGQRPLRSP